MTRSLFLVFSFLLISGMAFSQGKDNSLEGVPFKERIVTGGGFGLGFGSSQDFISVSPVIGYSLTKKLIAGTGLTYRYTNFKAIRPSVKLTDYAVNPFARYMVYNGFFVQAEYEYLNYELPFISGSSVETSRQNFDSVMAGGGVIQPLGRNLAFYAMVLYNFSYTNSPNQFYQPYSSPFVVRAGINIGGFLGL
jgi:hypothetical protein